MSRRRYVRATILWAGLFSAGFAAVAMLSPRPRLMWNASASAPVGLYRLEADTRPRLGELVAIAPPTATARMMAERHYLPIGVPLMKHVAASARAMGVPRRRCRLGGRQACRHSQIARQNGSAFAKLAGLSPRSDRRIVPVEPGARQP
jgi:type IV secretory pathway protease TraF